MQRTELVSILKASFEAGLLVDESGNVLFGNKAAQELFGIHLDSPTNLGIDQQVVFLHNKTRVSWNEIQHVSTETISVICTSGDGRRFSSIAKLALLGTFALVYIRRDEVDETMSLASSMAERALEQEQNLVAGIVDAALDPLFQINEKGVIKMVNKATTTQFGWTREEFIGSNISMIVG
jgi:PAS domain-containing protein